MRILIDLQSIQNGSRNRGIGRYTLALTRAIARNAASHQIFVLLNGLFPETIEEVRSMLSEFIPPEHILVFQACGPVAELNRKNSWRVYAAEIVREHFLSELAPDVVLVGSLFEGAADNTVSSIGLVNAKIPTAVILYDLIPFIYPEKYIASELARRWYFRKIDSLKRADLLLGISQSASMEAVDLLGIDQKRVVNIFSAADDSFTRVELSDEDRSKFLKRVGISRKFLMYASAYDPRKNFEGLIKAFAALPKFLRNDYQLVLVCDLNDSNHKSLITLAEGVGLGKGEIVLTDFIPDGDLILLYSTCHLFVFPSLHEGFGLPALEAMACGAAVIGSNTSSIPEVIGRDDALFDPHSTSSMAAAINRALTDESYFASLKQHSLVQALNFNWNKSALVTIDALEKLGSKCQSTNEEIESDSYLEAVIDQIAGIRSDAAAEDRDWVESALSIYKNERVAQCFINGQATVETNG